jgi:hypothetical protein
MEPFSGIVSCKLGSLYKNVALKFQYVSVNRIHAIYMKSIGIKEYYDMGNGRCSYY